MWIYVKLIKSCYSTYESFPKTGYFEQSLKIVEDHKSNF